MRWSSNRVWIHPFLVISLSLAPPCAAACATASADYGATDSGSDGTEGPDTGHHPHPDAGDTMVPKHDAKSIFGGPDAGTDGESDASEPGDAPGTDAVTEDAVTQTDGAEPTDSGHDARPKDDASKPPAEAGHRDATKDSTTHDSATRDSSTGHDSATHDTSTHDSATKDSGTTHDTGGTCTRCGADRTCIGARRGGSPAKSPHLRPG